MASQTNNSGQPVAVFGSHREPPPLVLLADDDTDVREAMAETLRDGGFEVVAFGRGTELLEFFTSSGLATPPTQIDVIVCDFWMPGMTGLAVLDALRGMQMNAPFILLTGLRDAELQAEAHRRGATAVVEKPMAFVKLIALCRQHLSR